MASPDLFSVTDWIETVLRCSKWKGDTMDLNPLLRQLKLPPGVVVGVDQLDLSPMMEIFFTITLVFLCHVCVGSTSEAA